MNKIISLCILLIAAYGVSVFMFPTVSSTIDDMIWVTGLSESIRGSKSDIDSTITNIPSASEFKSGAMDIKEIVVDWVVTTKDTIDTIRWWAQQVEETYNDAVDTYNDLKGTIEEAQEKVEQVQWVVESISNLTGSGS
mgnify:CR=1 FL=1